MKPAQDSNFICTHCGQWHPTSVDTCPIKNEAIPSSHKLVGTVMEGKYKIERLLGEGGMGVVYEATHTLIGRRLAVKVLHPDVAQVQDLVDRFYNEARTAAGIGHEHIIEITDMGKHIDSPYIVMEFLEGKALSDLMKERILSIEEATAISLQVLDALNAVHSKGVIHRDLKPDNIHVLIKGGRFFVKILDFGISKLKTPEAQDMHLTRTGTVLGTPYYMAPEQAAGKKDQDHRIDIYAAGVILYEMLTGNLPYVGDNYNALLAAILTEDPPRPRAYNPDIPVELENVIMNAIAKQPSQRYGNAVKVMEALRPFAPAWMGRPSRIPGLTQTQGGVQGQPVPSPTIAPKGDLGSSQTIMAPTPLPGMSSTSAVTRAGTNVPPAALGQTGGSATAPDWSMTAEPEAPPRRNRAGIFVAIGLVLLVLIGGAGVAAALVVPKLLANLKDGKGTEQIVATGGSEGSEGTGGAGMAGDGKGPASTGPATGQGTGDQGTMKPAGEVTLTLEGLPEGAVASLDGKPLEKSPATLPRSERPAVLAVVADGFEPWQTEVVLDDSRTVKVELTPAAEPEGGKKKKGVKGGTTLTLTDGGKTGGKGIVVEKLPPPEDGGKKKGTKGIYSGKKKNISLEYPE